MFGQVNFASKLGEDHAESGEILVAQDAFENLQRNHSTMLELVALKDGFVQISGVEISFCYVTIASEASAATIFPTCDYPEEPDIRRAAASTSHVRLMCIQLLDDDTAKEEKAKEQLSYLKQTCTILQSDMSGFTRLTNKYGILHFLTLVAHCRRIFRQNLPFYGGKVLKYDGDNIIAVFETPEDAAEAVRDIVEDINRFNIGKETDYQIRIKLGTSHGETLIVQNDCVGDAWEACCILGEDTAKVGEVLITESIHDQLKELDHLGASFEPRMTYDGTTPLAHFNMSFAEESVYAEEVNDAMDNTLSMVKYSKRWLTRRGKFTKLKPELEQLMLAQTNEVASIDQQARALYEKDGCSPPHMITSQPFFKMARHHNRDLRCVLHPAPSSAGCNMLLKTFAFIVLSIHYTPVIQLPGGCYLLYI